MFEKGKGVEIYMLIFLGGGGDKHLKEKKTKILKSSERETKKVCWQILRYKCILFTVPWHE